MLFASFTVSKTRLLLKQGVINTNDFQETNSTYLSISAQLIGYFSQWMYIKWAISEQVSHSLKNTRHFMEKKRQEKWESFSQQLISRGSTLLYEIKCCPLVTKIISVMGHFLSFEKAYTHFTDMEMWELSLIFPCCHCFCLRSLCSLQQSCWKCNSRWTGRNLQKSWQRHFTKWKVN